MKRSVQRPLPPMEVQRLDPAAEGGESPGPKFGPDPELDLAKSQIGRTVAHVLRVTDSSLKEFGDPSQVKRVCEGDISNVIARAYQRDPREFVKKLAQESGAFDVHTTIDERRTA